MPIYVIANKDESFLNSPVFYAGADDSGEAIAVFTERPLAEQYIADADWRDKYEVGELQPIQMLRWFTIAHEEGCDMVAINPVYASQSTTDRSTVVDLSEPLLAFADTLQTKLVTGGGQ